METTLLTTQDLRRITRHVGIDDLMRGLINALDEAFRSYDSENVHVPVRSGFSYEQPHSGLLEWMPVMYRGKSATVKMVGYHPNNPALHEIPTIISSVSMYDVKTGHLSGIMDGVFLTALRTGAASALAARYLASAQSRTVGIIGCGAQAVTQLHGLSTVFNIERVIAYDQDLRAISTFANRVAFLGLNIEVVGLDRREWLVSESDVLVTATSNEVGSGPVFEDVETRPWLHINAIGSDFPGKVEIPKSLLERAYVVPDFVQQAAVEGECQQLEPEQFGDALYQIISNPADYNDYRECLTVFDSTGWAIEDAVAAEMMFSFARELQIGTQIDIEHISVDPLNPYDFSS